MLKIEILPPGKNVTLGKGLLRTLQNEFMPNLDLLVRESIQNSLDAASSNSPYVDVDFSIGTFNSEKLGRQLEIIGEKLINDFPGEQKYLSIRDSGTVGLTGPLSHSEVQGQDFGNLVKLVYDIAKPQEQQGAGGSWGYGKTIFYRIGLGLVFYYSKIKKDDGGYEERLAAVMVENEDDPQSLIPPAQGTSTKSGVAWWGEMIGDNMTRPITDPKKINEILSIFGIDPYGGKETGTTIIIPYINEKEILDHNAILASNGLKVSQIFDGLEEYLSIVVPRWYTPRLNNEFYQYGNEKYLKFSINGERLQEEDIDPYFNVLKDMYNYAVSGREESIKFVHKEQLKREVINIQKVEGISLKESSAGFLVYGLFDYEELGLNRPRDPLNPHFLSNINIENDDANSAIVTYCRQPGMMINYEDKGEWANGLPTRNVNQYIISMFVLNSVNEVLLEETPKMSLEEYVRRGEESDHTTWRDHNLLGKNPRIIQRVQQNVNKKLKSAYEDLGPEQQTDNDGRLSAKAGELILPPIGFGKRARKRRKKQETMNISRKVKGGTTKVFLDRTIYGREGIKVPICFKILESDVNKIFIDLEIKSDKGSVKLEDYERELEQQSPLRIKECHFENQDGQRYVYASHIQNDNIHTKNTKLSTCYRVELQKDFFVGEIIEGYVVIEGVMKELAPVLRLKVEKVISHES